MCVCVWLFLGVCVWVKIGWKSLEILSIFSVAENFL